MWLVTALCVCAAVAPDLIEVRFPEDKFTPSVLTLLVIVLGCAVTAFRRLVLIRNALREPTA